MSFVAQPLAAVAFYADRPAAYRDLVQQLTALIGDETDLIANAANTSALLFDLLPDLNWAGFYLMKQGELVLGPFQGKPACIRIPLGRGVCGTAVIRPAAGGKKSGSRSVTSRSRELPPSKLSPARTTRTRPAVRPVE